MQGIEFIACIPFLGDVDTNLNPSPSWSAKADHPRVFVFPDAVKQRRTTEKRGWSAFADHDDGDE